MCAAMPSTGASPRVFRRLSCLPPRQRPDQHSHNRCGQSQAPARPPPTTASKAPQHSHRKNDEGQHRGERDRICPRHLQPMRAHQAIPRRKAGTKQVGTNDCHCSACSDSPTITRRQRCFDRFLLRIHCLAPQPQAQKNQQPPVQGVLEFRLFRTAACSQNVINDNYSYFIVQRFCCLAHPSGVGMYLPELYVPRHSAETMQKALDHC